MLMRVKDYGLVPFVAERIARDGYDVEYVYEWPAAFPTSDKWRIGRGIPGVKRIDSFFEDLDKPDILVFPDFYEAPLQKHCRKLLKKPVFGSGDAQELEKDRLLFKETLEKVGLPAIAYQECVGLDELKEYLEGLQSNARLVIKESGGFRGDWETVVVDGKNRRVSDVIESLPKRAHSLGIERDKIQLMCEVWVESSGEPGYDGFFGGGSFGNYGWVGYEEKGDANIMRCYRYEELPGLIKNVNDRLAPELAKRGHQGFYCMENRRSRRGTFFPNDICERFGSPSVEGLCEGIANFGDVVRDLALGKQPNIKPTAKYIGILKFHTHLLKEEHDKEIRYPDNMRQWVKIRNEYREKGKSYSISQDHGDNAGAVVSIGNSVAEVKKLCLERIEQVHCECMEYNKGAFDAIEGYIAAGREYGIEF